MTENIFLSVIIPSYNETKNLEHGVLDDVRDYLVKQKYSWEVIISDDGSPNQAGRRIAEEFAKKTPGFSYLQNEHAGKPFAIWSAINKSLGEILLFLDMDMSTPISETAKLLPYYNQDYDLVIGSRGTMRKNSSPFRLLASTVFRTFRDIFLLRDIVDTQCGFKSIRSSVAKELFPLLQVIRNKPTNLKVWKVTSYDVELLYAAQKHGYKIKEVPVEWEQRDLSMEVKKSSNKFKFAKESMEMAQEVIRVRLNDIKGYYNK